MALGVARKCIAITWKSDSPVPIARWFSEMNSCVPLEKVTHLMRNGLENLAILFGLYGNIVIAGVRDVVINQF